jgi:ferric-dicitrate binding protein FerR (iron transport regulator)
VEDFGLQGSIRIMTRAHEILSGTADRIEQEAAEWLVKVDRDGMPETSRALSAWLSMNPRHRAAFLRLSRAWRRADILRRLADPDEEPDPDLLAPGSCDASSTH